MERCFLFVCLFLTKSGGYVFGHFSGINPRKFAPGTPFQKWKCLVVAFIKTRAWVYILQLKLPCWRTQSLNFSAFVGDLGRNHPA